MESHRSTPSDRLRDVYERRAELVRGAGAAARSALDRRLAPHRVGDIIAVVVGKPG
jgi:hypothetical protein